MKISGLEKSAIPLSQTSRFSFSGEVTFHWVWLICEPASRSRKPRVMSLFMRATAFFLIYLVIYLFIFWHFKFNVNIFLSKWCTWQKKHKFLIFFHAWNSAQVVSIVRWRSVYCFRYEWNVQVTRILGNCQDDISRSTKVHNLTFYFRLPVVLNVLSLGKPGF